MKPSVYIAASSFFILSILTGCTQHAKIFPQHTLPTHCQYYSLKKAQCESDIIKALKPYQIIFIGDHHNADNLHQDIAHLITALSSHGTKVILANEWFYPKDEKILKAFVDNDINETLFIRDINWSERMGLDSYRSFKPIYEAVKSGEGELYGINLTPQERKRISDAKLSDMSQKEHDFFTRLDLNVSAHQDMVMPFLSHCHAKKETETIKQCTKRMYRVQVAWDSKMALESYKLAQKLKPNEKLIVFAGSMHMENKLGIPLRFSRLSTQPFVSIIPYVRGEPKIPHLIGDYALLYTPNDTVPKK